MNLAISHLRKAARRGTVSLDAPVGLGSGDDRAERLHQHLPDSREPDPAVSVEKKEALSHLFEALRRLEDEHRAVLVLRDLGEMDYQQIASVLGVPVGTVKSRLFRARLALREQMYVLYPGDVAGGGEPAGPGRTEGTSTRGGDQP